MFVWQSVTLSISNSKTHAFIKHVVLHARLL